MKHNFKKILTFYSIIIILLFVLITGCYEQGGNSGGGDQGEINPGDLTDIDTSIFVAVGVDLRRVFSYDGIDWEYDRSIEDSGYFRDVAYGRGIYVAVGDSGRRVRSNDAIFWTNEQLGGYILYGITYGE